jgi:hypothetical protein
VSSDALDGLGFDPIEPIPLLCRPGKSITVRQRDLWLRQVPGRPAIPLGEAQAIVD